MAAEKNTYESRNAAEKFTETLGKALTGSEVHLLDCKKSKRLTLQCGVQNPTALPGMGGIH